MAIESIPGMRNFVPPAPPRHPSDNIQTLIQIFQVTVPANATIEEKCERCFSAILEARIQNEETKMAMARQQALETLGSLRNAQGLTLLQAYSAQAPELFAQTLGLIVKAMKKELREQDFFYLFRECARHFCLFKKGHSAKKDFQFSETVSLFNQIARDSCIKGEHEKELSYYQKSLATFPSRHVDSLETARIQIKIGRAHRHCAHLHEDENCYQEGIKFLRKKINRPEQLKEFIALGKQNGSDVDILVDQLERLESTYPEKARSEDRLELAGYLRKLAKSQNSSLQPKKALESLQEALQFCRKNTLQYVKALFQMADSSELDGDACKAIDYINQSLECSLKFSITSVEHFCRFAIAVAELNMAVEKRAEALRAYQLGLSLMPSGNEFPAALQASYYYTMGHITLFLKRYAEAENYFLAAQAFNQKGIEGALAHGLGYVAYFLGRYADSVEHCRTAVVAYRALYPKGDYPEGVDKLVQMVSQLPSQ